LALLVAAASTILGLTAAERANVERNLLAHDAGASGWRLGDGPRGRHDGIPPEDADRGFAELRNALAAFEPDVAIFDNLAALFALPNENDNNSTTTLMRRLGRVARQVGCAMLLLHHTPKMTRESAAGQRGEATLVRGGSAITNVARIVITITGLLSAEAGLFAVKGLKPDSIRRLDHAKLNDAAPMNPVAIEVASVQVTVADGTNHSVRAVRFLPPLPAASAGGGIPDSFRNVAMKAIDAGFLDDQGTKVPLSPGGGRNNGRNAVKVVGAALSGINPRLDDKQAEATAKAILKDLIERIGCVVVEDVQVPKYSKGKLNGHKTGLSHLTEHGSSELVRPSGPLAFPSYGYVRPGVSQDVKRQFPQDREVLRPVILPISGVILIEAHIEHPVQTVLDPPVRAHRRGEGHGVQ
jgi:hypothetical protein